MLEEKMSVPELVRYAHQIDGTHSLSRRTGNRVYGAIAALGVSVGTALIISEFEQGNYLSGVVGTLIAMGLCEPVADIFTGKHHTIGYHLLKIHPKFELIKRGHADLANQLSAIPASYYD
jgi:hypothetical protein